MNLSSSGHRFSDVDLEDPNFEHTPYTEFGAYGRSKTANILFAVEFDRRHKARGVRATAVHPGGIQTELGRYMTPEVREQLIARRSTPAQPAGRAGLPVEDHPAGRGDLGLGRRRRAGRRGGRPLLRGLPRRRDRRRRRAVARRRARLRARSRARQGALGQERGDGRRDVLNGSQTLSVHLQREPFKRELRGVSTMTSKVWFITGTSKGFGRVWAQAALARGDRVAATARDVATPEPLTAQYGDLVAAIALDVTDKAAVARRWPRRLSASGASTWRSTTPAMACSARSRRSARPRRGRRSRPISSAPCGSPRRAAGHARPAELGHIIQVSSIGGVNAFPSIGLYHASKWGLEGFSQALAAEVAAFGIKVTIVEPGGYATDWGGPSAQRATPMPPMTTCARRGRSSAAA